MLSILIPNYNYDIKDLVNSLFSELKNLKIEWEICVYDDASTLHFSQNLECIKTLNDSRIQYLISEKNIGNAEARNNLIYRAKYSWLLFLDSDVMPAKTDFISCYLSAFEKNQNKIIAGNVIYSSEKFKNENALRWKFGNKAEAVSLEQRQKAIFKNVRLANFAIPKSLIADKKFKNLENNYGYLDLAFFTQFNENQIIHIENPVFHNGLESNKIFIEKTQKAIQNANFILKNNSAIQNQISLIKIYKKIRFLRPILNLGFNLFEKPILKNLYSINPSVKLFQIYKLLYLSHLDKK